MAKGKDAPSVTPARAPATLKKQSSSATSSKNQPSIMGFFSKTPNGGPQPARAASQAPSQSSAKSAPSTSSKLVRKPSLFKSSAATQRVTPMLSSDANEGPSSDDEMVDSVSAKVDRTALPSPLSSAKSKIKQNVNGTAYSSPSRKAKKAVSYAESGDEEEEEEDDFVPAKPTARKRLTNKRPVVSDDYDEFGSDGGIDDEDLLDLADGYKSGTNDSEAQENPKKRKRATETVNTSKKRIVSSLAGESEDEDMDGVPSTAQQWKFDPANTQPLQPRSGNAVRKPSTNGKKPKAKAHKSEPDQRYPWLAKLMDMDRNPKGHPDYDPRTVFIPPLAWTKFSPFEKQYWEIKQKLFNTIVFFKKGKFYELYEDDATIGHQLFDLKLTDRVNMRMVGVPESSLDHWVNQFVAKGYKIARVDQAESALGKEMRERDDAPASKGGKAKDKIIRRELACIMTRGTLVEGSMLADDMATYCVAIKESVQDDLPVFGISFVDTATGQFFLTEFVDDADLTKFETFVAQCRPAELLIEKSCISIKAIRILKNNTTPLTIWTYLKPGTEFWTADTTVREIENSGYFQPENKDEQEFWPDVLEEAREKEFVMSSFGALLQYLRILKIERDLISQGNFTWYDPIKKATTLVLDGQTLINLEIFANTFDGGNDGTLFTLLNRCVTPFGKRMLRQWLCHPLLDPVRINERLDAVEMINNDMTLRDQFTSLMTKMPDLERFISRIHAGVCKPDDFVRVLEGFEQIEYTMNLLEAFDGAGGMIDRLIKAMPDLSEPLAFWKSAFDRSKAKEAKLLIPEHGVEEDFDDSQARIEEIKVELEGLLKNYRKKLGSNKDINYNDLGKEIYQLEVPAKLKVPQDWQQMSATAKLKRYYTPELRVLVRQLQEAQETHGQIVKEVSSRFFKRFDENYNIWSAAVGVIAQLDCLISLAKASTSLGEPSCRPMFVDDERSVVEFEELRHPCILPNVTDFIPNDINLGGETPNITLLTGANAAGKSTVLRMTCIAVIMAQIGCYVPCTSARLTPVDRIMSRLGANDNIFAAQSTFLVELSETKKILSEATPRSLVILDELGRGTSSYDGVAVAQSVLHHVATHIGCIGFFATHYHSLATEFENHPEIVPKRMQIHVDEENRRITFLYKLEEGVAEGSFGMHCAAMCGIPSKVVDRAEVAAREWEHTSRLKESLEAARGKCYVPLGMQSDVAWLLRGALGDGVEERGLQVLMKAVEGL